MSSLTSLSIVRISFNAKKKYDEIRRLNKASVLCHSELRIADLKPAAHERYLLSKNSLVTIGVSKSPLPRRVRRRFKSFCPRLPFSPGTHKQKLSKRCRTGGTSLRQCSRGIVCSAYRWLSRVRRADLNKRHFTSESSLN